MNMSAMRSNNVPLFWLMIVKSMLRLFYFLHYVRMIQKPFSRVVSYSQFFDNFIDLVLIDKVFFLCSNAICWF
ncbi:hypothetical protein L3X38_026715 [Prunus dulcis]|uniref:Uncharacterized protein n=2 Tax=Prunus dulcis TaxID=3755 RepID=A0AAD4VN14_PRUDU|nr:hypothetical protein L3X38_026715 [Prunus dulcis]